jgi:co-chaperonin GroES (HSP10)
MKIYKITEAFEKEVYMKINPTQDKVLLQIEKMSPVSKGGIFDPRADKRITPFGKVVAVGPDVTRVGVGDVVYYDVHEGWRLEGLQLITKEEFLYAQIV